jgi:YHS domain-containing protein
MSRRQIIIAISACAGLALARSALAQHDAHQPSPKGDAAAPARASERFGYAYPFDTCPISGKELGSMGGPVVKLYDGREVRFCCPGCPPKFEKDLAASLSRLDERVVKDQAPLYPLKTSIVTGNDLPAKPYDFVYGNRLVRLGSEAEKNAFLKDPKTFLATLDKAVVEQQGKHYPLKTCPVSKDELGGDMGKPVDVIVAGRLVRLCCKDCKKDIDKDPAKFIAMVDAARKDAGDHGQHEPEDHDGRGHEEPAPHHK